MNEERIYVLSGIRLGFTNSGHTDLTGQEALFDSLRRVCNPDERVFPSLASAYHADLRLLAVVEHEIPPSIASVVFVNLSLPGFALPFEIQMVRQYLPCAVFVLYATDEDFRRCMEQLPAEWSKQFRHYFLLRKPIAEKDTDFDKAVREILDQARETAIKKKEQHPRFHSAFISYSHQDRLFVEWILDHLASYGIQCWLDEKQLNAGDKIHTKVDEAISERDKVLLCASRNSLTSWWVDNEINSAIAKEQRQWKELGKETLVLVPLNLDDYLFSAEWKNGWKNQLVSRLAPDFTLWNARVDIDSASNLDERLSKIDEYKGQGKDVLRSTGKALDSVRRALLVNTE